MKKLINTVLVLSFLSFLGCNKDEVPNEANTLIDVDGNVYKTIKIGNQVWMQSNLKVSRYRNGDPIQNQWDTMSSGACSWYDEDSLLYDEPYGMLYNWYAVNDPRGLAPQGWHIPTSNEWNLLVMYLGGDVVAGGKMKSNQYWASPNGGGDNSSGFSALPGGIRAFDGSINAIGVNGWWWSSSSLSATNASGLYLNSYYSDANFTNYDKRGGFSVRCVRD